MAYAILYAVVVSVLVFAVVVAPPFTMAAIFRVLLRGVRPKILALLAAAVSLLLYNTALTRLTHISGAASDRVETAPLFPLVEPLLGRAIALAFLYMFAQWGIDLVEFIKKRRRTPTARSSTTTFPADGAS